MCVLMTNDQALHSMLLTAWIWRAHSATLSRDGPHRLELMVTLRSGRDVLVLENVRILFSPLRTVCNASQHTCTEGIQTPNDGD